MADPQGERVEAKEPWRRPGKAKMPAGGTAGRHLKEEGPAWEKRGNQAGIQGNFV